MDIEKMSLELASEVHESWKQPRFLYEKKGERYYEPRWKETGDDEMDKKIVMNDLKGRQYRINPQTLKPEIDIANLTFDKLSKKYQTENYLGAKTALTLSLGTVQDLSSIIHDEWLKRNEWVKNDPKLGKPYSELSKVEQVKDMDFVVRAMVKIYETLQQEAKAETQDKKEQIK